MTASIASLDGLTVRRRAGGAKIAWFGGGLLALFVGLALLAPSLSPYRPTAPVGAPLEAPSASHLLGTNAVGQDLMSQMLSGARTSLLIAAVAGVGTLVLGTAVGVVAGWFGGWVDTVAMRVVDFILALPRLPLLIVTGAYVGPSTAGIAAIIALTFWPGTARVTRSQVLSLRPRAHLRAAVGFGASSAHVLARHVLPELTLILAAELVSAVRRAVMLEAGLAFLGLGDPTRSSWGNIIREALDFGGLFFTPAWRWWLVPPLVAVTSLLLAVTFVGMTLEARVNPRLARHRGQRR